MIRLLNILKLKDGISASSWATGQSISLKYKLFSCSDSGLYLCFEKKISPEQKQFEKIAWFSQYPVCSLSIDQNGYFAYILSANGLLVRLPLSIFGVKEALEEWNKQLQTEGENIILTYKKLWEKTPNLKEIQIVELKQYTLNCIFSIEGKKIPDFWNEKLLQKFFQINLWRASDKKEWGIISCKSGMICFICLQTLQIQFGIHLETIKSVKLVETQSLTFLLITFSPFLENIQLILQKNKTNSTNLLTDLIKSPHLISKTINYLINCKGFNSYSCEEGGAIRLFFHNPQTGVLKVYRPVLQSSSKYRFFLIQNEIDSIIQWKNYYIVFSNEEDYPTVKLFLKGTLMKCDKKSIDTPNFTPQFSTPLFQFNLNQPNTTSASQIRYIISSIFSFTLLDDKFGEIDLATCVGILRLKFDILQGKEALEQQLLSEDFNIANYYIYIQFLKNHSFDIDSSLESLQQALKAAQRWETLCLIDLHNKTKDPFRLFHEYSSLYSTKTEQLLLRSLVGAYEKVEIIDERISDGFNINILLGLYGVKCNSPELGMSPQFKKMHQILEEQQANATQLIKIMRNQGKSDDNQFFKYLINLDRNYEDNNEKKLIDFSEWNGIFKQRRHAELILNTVYLVLSLKIQQKQRERLDNLDELLGAMVVQGYYVNDNFLNYQIYISLSSSECPPLQKAILTLLTINSQKGNSFHNSFNYFIQQLTLSELVLTLYISIRCLKIMYSDIPLLQPNCLLILLQQFHSLSLNFESLKQLLEVTLLQSAAVRALKVLPSEKIIKNVFDKMQKQRHKLISGSQVKYLPGIDAAWLMLIVMIEKIKRIQAKDSSQIGHQQNQNEHNIHFQFSEDQSIQQEALDSQLLAQVEEVISQIYKMTSPLIKKIISPCIKLAALVDSLPP